MEMCVKFACISGLMSEKIIHDIITLRIHFYTEPHFPFHFTRQSFFQVRRMARLFVDIEKIQ